MNETRAKSSIGSPETFQHAKTGANDPPENTRVPGLQHLTKGTMVPPGSQVLPLWSLGHVSLRCILRTSITV
jgi:hypothetical protein